MNTIKYLTLVGLLVSYAFSQQVLLSYEVNTLEDQSVELVVYAQSATASSFDLAALNTSVALPEGCVALKAGQNMMLDSWTDYLERGTEVEALSLEYDGMPYAGRFQYGNANPGLPATSEIILPPVDEQAPVLFTRTFKGNCQDLYLEHQLENSLNQLSGPDMESVTYSIQHPQRPVVAPAPEALFALEVSPNPTSDWAYVKFSEIGNEKERYGLKVFDVNGALIFTRTSNIDPAADNTVAVDLRKEAAGIYIVEVVNLGKGQSQATKLMKY